MSFNDAVYRSWRNVYKNHSLTDLPWERESIHPELKYLLDRSIPNNITGCALDLGCGTGATSRYLAQRNYSVDAWDISENAINIAINRSQNINNLFYHVGNALDEAFSHTDHYDLILDYLFLHHIQSNDINLYTDGILNTLKNKGLYIVGFLSEHDSGHMRNSSFSSGKVLYWDKSSLSEVFYGKLHLMEEKTFPLNQQHSVSILSFLND